MPPPSPPPGERRRAATPPPRPPVQEQEGPLLLLRVRALVPDKVTLSDPAQRTVRATVLAIDEELNQIKVQTDAGQRLGLFLPPETLAHLRLGTRCLLQVGRESMQERHTPAVQEGPFSWPMAPLPWVPRDDAAGTDARRCRGGADMVGARPLRVGHPRTSRESRPRRALHVSPCGGESCTNHPGLWPTAMTL